MACPVVMLPLLPCHRYDLLYRSRATVTSPPSLGTGTGVAAHRQPADPIVPRKIRMDPSVKERRGLGRPHDDRESGS